MRIVWSWLAEWVDVSGLPPEAVAEALTAAGLPVEDMRMLAPEVSGVVVGLVRTCEPHPRADRLRVCTVDVGEPQPLTLVCGAQNVAAGQSVAVARVGAMLPQGEIREAEIRGVKSQGMICSATELGLDVRMLTDQPADGILVLRDVPVGADVVDVLALKDTVLEVELTPNRGDCLSVRGIAHEVAALFDRDLIVPSPVAPEVAQGALESLRVSAQTALCSAYCGQVVTHVAARPSPHWLQMRLYACGIRSLG
ncbi:MAG: phenylalanine--tRNA ligase subunit beta, partial [Firmicutes bacterium]|nr:phenylalanine--tRNA ligase subunit beta [Bacillota bacterium]